MTYLTEDSYHVMGTPEEVAYEVRAAEGSLWTAGNLVIAIFAMFAAALGFAYFYLRSSNSDGLWRPHAVTAPTATGAAIMAFTVAAAVLSLYGLQRLRRGILLDWEVTGWTALLAALIALGLQCWEFTDLPFFPGSSGYASVFIAWSITNIAFLFAAAYWTETQLVRHIRLRRAYADEGGSTGLYVMSRLSRINAVSLTHFWVFAAAVGVFYWIFFYAAA